MLDYRRKMLRSVIFIVVIMPTFLFGQSATFSADTMRFFRDKFNRRDIYDKIMESEWKIDGRTLRYGSAPIVVKTDNRIDTILFRQFKTSKWDTLICNISEAKNYKFQYNECCGAFNVSDETNKFIIGSVNFKLKGKTKNRYYLGTLGETGIRVTSQHNDTLKPGCRSAMSPNVYWLTFGEIEPCKDSLHCYEVTCLYEKGKDELNYEYGYKTMSCKLKILYLPLSIKPITVIYDPKSDSVKIQ